MTQGYEPALSVASRRHDIIGMHIYDKMEKDIPNIGLIEAVDAETDKEIIIDTSSSSVRKKLQDWFSDNYQYYDATFNRYRSDHLSINTQDDYVKLLLQFFKKRSG